MLMPAPEHRAASEQPLAASGQHDPADAGGRDLAGEVADGIGDPLQVAGIPA
jgi:hypothetical protein